MVTVESGDRVREESGLIQRVRLSLRNGPSPPPWRIVVGLSGGADSLATAAVLRVLAAQGIATVTAVHVDHGARPDSSGEQAIVATLAAALRLPFRGATLPGDLRARHPGLGWEEAARRERFQALANVASAEGATIIALGHHASDQAETVLLHLLRGAGLRGVGGMREWSERPIPWWTEPEGTARFLIWRPVLREAKATLQSHIAELGLEPIEDPSNDTLEFKRNRIRHEILPRMELLAPGATDAIGRYAAIAASDDAYLGLVAEAVAARLTAADGTIKSGLLLAEHPAIQARVVQTWLRRDGLEENDVGLDRVDAVLALARSNAGDRWVEVGSRWIVSLRHGRLRRSLGSS